MNPARALSLKMIFLLTAFVLFLCSIFGVSIAEHTAWDCPECGRTGNTGNFCGGCAHPAPWNQEESNPSDDVASSNNEGINHADKGEKLLDLDFADPEGLEFSQMEGGEAAAYYQNGMVMVYISNPGSEAWSVQPVIRCFQLTKGTEYELSWDMRCSTERDVAICFQHAEEDWHVYVSQVFPVTEEMQHYTLQFTMTEETDPLTQLVFNLGFLDSMEGTAAMKQHQVYIDNIQLNAWE